MHYMEMINKIRKDLNQDFNQIKLIEKERTFLQRSAVKK
jgi:hypothetical protein